VLVGNRGRGQLRDDDDESRPDDAIAAPGDSAPRRGGGRADRRRLARKVKRKRRRGAAQEVPILIVVALLIALVLKTFLLQAFVIPSGSMESTIRIGDRVLVDKLTPWFGSHPQRGDVVVFQDPGGWLPPDESGTGGTDPVVIKQVKEFLTFIGLLPSSNAGDLIKRVVAVGGDTVKCCDAQGRVTVNGTPLNETSYIDAGNPPSQQKFTVQVPLGRLWVMGDHRSDSADSRFHMDQPGDGTIPESLVVGRAFVIAWPMGHMARLPEPATFRSVPAARGDATTALRSANNRQGLVQLPTPAELPLVMGVVGPRIWRRRQRDVRSGCGGPGGRRPVRTRRARGAGFLGGLRRDGRRGDGRQYGRPWS
jgi:signal peptidase I